VHANGTTYYLTDAGGDDTDENWVISEEQGKDKDSYPENFIKLGTS